MKKAYLPPDIAYESFSLSTSIAACEVETNFDKGNCGYRFSYGYVIFLAKEQGCSTEVVDGSPEADGICYHNPTDTKNLFQS